MAVARSSSASNSKLNVENMQEIVEIFRWPVISILYARRTKNTVFQKKMSRIISSGGVLKHTVSVSHYLLYAHLRGMKEELPTLLKCLLCPNLQPDRPDIASVQDRLIQIKN